MTAPTTTSTASGHDATSVPVRYSFGTGQPAGVWLGFGPGRLTLLGSGLIGSVLALTARAPLPAAAVPAVLCTLLAAAQVFGRPLAGWVAPALAQTTAGLTGRKGWTHAIPTQPLHPEPSSCPPRTARRLRLPAEYGRLTLSDADGDPTIGLLLDRPARTVTVLFDVAGVDRFALLDSDGQDGLLAGWGQALSVLADADPQLSRLQIVERATRGDDCARWPHDTAGGDELEQAITALTAEHRSLLACQWRLPALSQQNDENIAGRCRAVSSALFGAQLLTRPLSSVEVTAELEAMLRGRNFQPAAGSQQHTGRPGAVSRRASWTDVRIDDTYHRGYAITSWPRSTVSACWLSPLLLTVPDGATRTVTMHLERVEPAAAARAARSARARAQLDRMDRARFGMAGSAALDRAEAAGIGMDDELAAGFRTHRLAGLVTLSATSRAGLDTAARSLAQAAAAARLELRALHGQHELALAATAPLCRVRSRGAQ